MSRDPLEELFGPLDSDDAESGVPETPRSAPETDQAKTVAFDAPETHAPAAEPFLAETAPFTPPREPEGTVPQEPVSWQGSNSDVPTQPFNPFPDLDSEPAQATVEELFPDAVVLPAPVRSVRTPTASPIAPPAAPFPAARTPTPVREELPTQPVPAGGKKLSAALPWIIIGVVGGLLLVGALIFVNMAKGSDAQPEPTPEAPVVEEPVTTPSDEPSDQPEPEPVPEPSPSEAPAVDVGSTGTMDISYAGISVEFSHKLTNIQWYFQSAPTERVLIESGLMNSFPDSCAAMRSPSTQSPWGIEQDTTGKWVVVRPEGTCAADPDLYNEVWGLMQALADSATPLED